MDRDLIDQQDQDDHNAQAERLINARTAGLPLALLMNLSLKFRDDEQRPLAESKTPFEYQQDVPMDLMECPYSGSRYKHYKSMNVSALKQLNRHWNGLIETFANLRAHYLHNSTLDQPLALSDIYQLSIAGYIMPSYLFYRSVDFFIDGELPAMIAAIYKAASGLVNSLQVMITKNIITGQYQQTVLDAATLLTFIDQEGLLIGEWEVCAGPPNLIRDLLNAIINRSDYQLAALPFIADADCYFNYAKLARQVLLIDFLFPLIYYFCAIDYRADFFARLYHDQGWSIAAFADNQIAMELQLFSQLVPALDKTTAEIRAQCKQRLIDTLTDIDADNAFRALLTGEHKLNDEMISKRDAITALLANAPQSSNVTPNQLIALTEWLALYLSLEHIKLIRYAEIQTAMNRILGRDDRAIAPDGLELSRMYNRKLRDLLADLLILHIDHRIDRIVIRSGSNQLQF